MSLPVPIILCVSTLAVILLLVSEYDRYVPGIVITKPLASLGFVVLAILLGAFHSSYGLTLLIGLCFAFLGDLLLIPKSEKFFQAGVIAFLVGHIAYAISFVRLGLDPSSLILSLIGILVIQRFILKWLKPHIPSNMTLPILAYVQTISLMVIFAISSARHTANPFIAVGAVAFFLSDLAVARDKFVQPGFINKLWGLPLYYGAQFILAGSTRFLNLP